jgi:hypothetical protein
VLVLRRIMCVVGVLTEAEAAAAVGLLNGQRWVSRQERMERKGKERTTHVLRVTICIWFASPRNLPLPPVPQDLFHHHHRYHTPAAAIQKPPNSSKPATKTPTQSSVYWRNGALQAR